MQRLIDANALTDELIRESEADTSKSIQTSFAKSVCMILCKAIEQQPTIDAEPVKHGKWITKKNSGINCSVCGHSRWSQCYMTTVLGFNYCPNCGARMDEE